jgi:hypothetical protein
MRMKAGKSQKEPRKMFWPITLTTCASKRCSIYAENSGGFRIVRLLLSEKQA